MQPTGNDNDVQTIAMSDFMCLVPEIVTEGHIIRSQESQCESIATDSFYIVDDAATRRRTRVDSGARAVVPPSTGR